MLHLVHFGVYYFLLNNITILIRWFIYLLSAKISLKNEICRRTWIKSRLCQPLEIVVCVLLPSDGYSLEMLHNAKP